MNPRPCVFIQTNDRQIAGAMVAEYALRRNSAHADAFDVRLLDTRDHPYLAARDGQLYLRDGKSVPWEYENLQSFTPLRFRPPEVMGYEGRAVVIDPDVFAVQDVWELLTRDMAGAAVVGRLRSGLKGKERIVASSVMLLDCAKLRHWQCEEQFDALFEHRLDYTDWIGLRTESPDSIGFFEEEWNDFDRLTPRTKMLHTTRRQTQPWKTGLPIDFTYSRKPVKALEPSTWLRPLTRLRRSLVPSVYVPNPDPAQERFFFGLLRECLEKGIMTEDFIRDEMRKNHLRHDTLELLERSASSAM